MSENETQNEVSFRPYIYIKYRAFSPLKETRKYFKNLSVYSTQEINNLMDEASSEETTKKVLQGTAETVKNQRSRKKSWLRFIY